MSVEAGTYMLGPENGELLVHTRRQGAAAKAGHDLEILVTRWTGTLQIGESTSLGLTADSSSLRVREGRGGMKALDEADKDNIRQTIDDEVLQKTPIEFRSSGVRQVNGGLQVRGELELMGETRPLEFDLDLTADGRVTGTVTVKQSAWGIKPYSALFGALKVADEVEITVQAGLQSG